MLVIPTYNERKNIRELVKRIRKVLPEAPVLFVDDNSPDGTAAEIKELMKADPKIRLLTRPGKQGLGSAYRAGFAAALGDADTDYVVEMDADLSHSPEAVPSLLQALESHDIAVGSRYTQGGRTENWNWFRRLVSRMGNRYAKLMAGGGVEDLTAGFAAYRKSALKEVDLNSIRSEGYAFQIELKTMLASAGADVTEVPIVFSERRVGESKFSSGIFWEGVRVPLKIRFKKIREAWLKVVLGVLVTLVPFFAYVLTAPHTIYLGDSAEYVMAVATGGIPHPPGYPTYMVLAKLFSLLPLGSLPFRLAIFSSVCASFGLLFVYLIGLRLFKPAKDDSAVAVAAAAIPLLLAFTDIFWSQAIMAKVYQLHLLIVLALVWLIIKFWERPKAGYIFWSAFLFGAGFGAHQIILFFVPVFLLGFIIQRERTGKLYIIHPLLTWRVCLAAICLGLLGLGFYAYLPIRAAAAGYHWGPLAPNLKSFMEYVGRTEYADLANSFDWKSKAEFIVSFFGNLFQQFRWTLALCAPGLVWLFQKRRSFALLSASMFLLNSLGIILTRSLPWSFDGEAFSAYYYLPAYAVAAVWIGAGLYFLADRLRLRRAALPALAVLAAIFPVYFGLRNFAANNLHSFTFSDDYSRAILESLKPDAVLAVSFNGAVNDSLMFSLLYQQRVNGVRPDVKILDGYDVYPDIDRAVLNKVYQLDEIDNFRRLLINYSRKAAEYKDRPLYASYPQDGLTPSWTSFGNGLVFAFGQKTAPAPALSALLKDGDRKALETNYFGRDLLAQYYYGRAAGLLDAGDSAGAEQAFLAAIKNDNEVMSEDAQGFVAHREKLLNLKK